MLDEIRIWSINSEGISSLYGGYPTSRISSFSWRVGLLSRWRVGGHACFLHACTGGFKLVEACEVEAPIISPPSLNSASDSFGKYTVGDCARLSLVHIRAYTQMLAVSAGSQAVQPKQTFP